jgi:tetratricopeptide (TPR) repeat protein
MILHAVKYATRVGLFAIGVLVYTAGADDAFNKLISSGKYADAIKYAEDNIPVGSRDADLWAKLGSAYENQQFNEKALACYMVSLRSSKNYNAYVGAARIYNELKQPETAIDMAKKAMEIKPTGEASWQYARACIALGKPDEAKTALEKVVQSDPSNVVANRELGLIYYKAKNYQKSIDMLKVALKSGGSGDIALMIANAYRSTNQMDNAVEYLRIAQQDPKVSKSATSLELARIYFQKGKYSEAAENFAKADKASMSASDLFQHAYSMEKSGENEDACMRAYSLATAKFGSAATNEALQAREKYGRWCLKKKNFSEALSNLQIIYNADPQGKTVKDIPFLMADALIGTGSKARAVPYLETVIARDAQNVEAYARLSELYTALGQAAKARAVQEKLVGLQPNNPKIQLALGQYNLKAGKNADALKYFQKSFMIEPTAEAAEGMTMAAWETKQFDLARDAAESALHYDATLAGPQRILARIYMVEKNYQGARQMLEKIVKQQPGDKALWLDLALCYEKLNDVQMLAEADKTIMSLDKKDVTSRVRYARYCMSTNNQREAMATFKDLMALSPKDPAVVKTLADLSTKLGNTADAIMYLGKYTALAPGDAEAQRDLGNMLYDKKDLTGALGAYRAAFKANPALKGLFKRYAELVISQKAPAQETYAVLSAAVKANEAGEEAFMALGDMYQKQKVYNQAIDMYQQALQQNPKNAEALSALAACQANAGRNAEAILTYEQVTAMRPGNAEEQKALGDLYSKEGKTSQAVAAYKRYLEKTPGDSKIAQFVGDYEYDQKNYRDAVVDYGKVTGPEANKADFLFRFGTAAYQLNDTRKTEELFKKLIVIDPKNATAYKTLYDIAQKNKEMTPAAEYLKRYTALTPSDDKMLLTLGDLLYSQKDETGSLAAYRGALKANPKAKGFFEKYVSLVSTKGTPQELMTAMSAAVAAGEATMSMYKQLGDIYYKAANYPRAIEMYEKASQLDPKNGTLLTLLAECQAKSGKVDMAAMTYEQAIAMNPAANKEYKNLGDLYMRLKKTEPAVRAYKKYLEKNPDNAIAKLVGEQAMAQKNYPEAVKYLSMVSGSEAKSAPFLLSYGNACYQARDDSKALPIYKQLAVLMPQSPDVFNTLYELTLRSGTKDEAVLYLKKYAALKPGDPQAQRTLGDLLYDKKDRAGALVAYRTLAKADPKAKGFYKRYAELVMTDGKEPEVSAVLNAAITMGEGDAGMYKYLGDRYLAQKLYPKAASMYEKASQQDPKNGSLLTSLADCQIKSGNVSAATLSYEQAIAMNPNASKEYKALGDLYMQQKKTEPAIRSYKKYLERNSDNGIAKLIGENALNSKNYVEAVKYLGMVTGEDARAPAFLIMYGKACYNTRGEESKALTIYKQLAVVSPQNPDVFQTLFDLESKSGSKEQALNYLKRYAALKPDDAPAQRTLGDMLYERKDGAGALVAYRAALKADPKAKGFFKRYAELALKSASPQEKIQVLSGAIEANEADASMYRVLADVYRSQGLCDKAIPLYDKSIKIDPRDPKLFSSLAECQLKTGRVNDALLTYEQATAMNPNANTEHKALGDLYMQQKKTDKAIKAYKKYVDRNPKESALAKFIGEFEFKAKNYSEACKYLGMVTGPDAKTIQLLDLYGKSCYLSKDYPTADKIYKQLAVLSPGNPDVFKTLYEIAGRLQKPEDVVTYLKRYTKLKPADAEAQRFLGDQLYDRKEYKEALAAYNTVLKTNPSAKGFYKKYVDLVLKVGSGSQKIAALNGAIAAGEADAGMYATLGDLYRESGNCNKAVQMYNKALDADPKNTALMFSQADCQVKSGHVREATVSYEQALAMNPAASKEYKTLGSLYMQQKKQDQALSAYKKYLEKNSSDAQVAMLMGDVAFAAKKYDEAYRYYGLVKDDASPNFLAQYGLAAMETKNYTTAISMIERLRSSKGETALRAPAYRALAEAYEKSGDTKKAADVLNSYVNLPGVKDPDAAYQRASVYESVNPAQAVKMYEDNIAKYPRDYRNFLKLGSIYAKQKATRTKGIKYLEKCAALADTIPRVWFDLGQMYSEMGRSQDMLQAFRKYIQIDQQNVDQILKIGEILLVKRMVDDAMVFLEMANALRENDPKIMTLLARGYIITKRREDGAKLIEKVIKLSNGKIDDDMRMVLIDVYLENGQNREAIAEINKMLSTKRNNALLLKYAKALYAVGMYPEAINAIEDIKSTQPENLDAIMILGKVLIAQKKYNEAVETYKEALYINQYYAPAMVERATVYYLQGKYQWAKTFYERALKVDKKLAPAYLGLARVAKAEKDMATYQSKLDIARKLDPNDKEIQAEVKSMKR